MREAEARAALRAFDHVGGLERWIEDQPWLAAPGGWVEPVAGGVRAAGFMRKGEPAAWVVPA